MKARNLLYIYSFVRMIGVETSIQMIQAPKMCQRFQPQTKNIVQAVKLITKTAQKSGCKPIRSTINAINIENGKNQFLNEATLFLFDSSQSEK